MLQITEEASPVRVYHPFEPFTQESLPTALQDILEAGKSMPVAEPLNRIDRALEALIQESDGAANAE
jgi:hypothetical protein